MNHVTGTHLSAYPFWGPNFGGTWPLMPPGWPNWKLWQNAETRRCDDVDGTVDTDRLNESATMGSAHGG
jgi:GH25 family lysozyme M1 (1,4-beta-N-acetylmuramidase)